jgi:hypothetical protein
LYNTTGKPPLSATGSRYTRTGQHRHLAANESGRAAQETVVFVVGQRGGLAGGTGNHNALDTCAQLQTQQALPAAWVERAVGLERRRERGDDAGK